MAKTGIYQPIDTVAGVQPPTDKTEVNTVHYTYADKIRFENGTARKIKGWVSQAYDYGETVLGTIRTVFTEIINGKFYIVLGTNRRLYSLIGSVLTNITPLKDTSESAANSLSTHYGTLANNPLASTLNSPVLTITDPEAALFEVGDIVTLSGATGFAGILAAAINGDKLVRGVDTLAGTYTINVGVNANATTTGGGASVVRSSGLLTIASVAHGNIDGQRVKIADAVDTGGILAAEINQEFIIRNVLTDSFDFMTVGTATSSVTAAGGASTIYFEEIPEGPLNEQNVLGYGAGMYGAGLYGTALVSNSARSYPRIWFCDRYADTIVMTPGNQTGVYQWQGSNGIAPAKITNAPDEVNYVFVSDNIIVTFGAANGGNSVENRIYASDQNNITVWTSSSTNQVYDDDIEGAGRLISHVPVEDYNLIFTENQTYTFRYIGLPFVWEVKELDPSIGIIAPMARANAEGIAYWMGQDNFYMYRGGTVEVIRANSQDESTCLNYVFSDLNFGQKSKIHAWYNKGNGEVWFHYPSSNSNECDRVVVVNIRDFTWTLHLMDRTASEAPSVKLKNPRLANVGTLYQHEIGYDADGQPMPFILTTNKRYGGRDSINLNAVIPDSLQSGTVNFREMGYQFPQSPIPVADKMNLVTQTTERIPMVGTGRYHQYTYSGEDLDQFWTKGDWLEEIQKGPTE